MANRDREIRLLEQLAEEAMLRGDQAEVAEIQLEIQGVPLDEDYE
jgi:hypothetical protein